MRRSAAPSARKDAVKRPRFSTPWAAGKATEMVADTHSVSHLPTISGGNTSTPSQLTLALQSIRKPHSSTSSPSSSLSCTSTSSSLSSSSAVLRDVTQGMQNFPIMSEVVGELDVKGTIVEEGKEKKVEEEQALLEGDQEKTNTRVIENSRINASSPYSTPKVKTFGIKRLHPASFNPPGTSSVHTHEPITNYTQSMQTSDEVPVTHYYRVMWCKLSKKKHKTWEGDAFLVAKGRAVTLKDTEGKDIGRGTGYRTSELSGLVEGSTLIVGGKEVEVMSKMTESEWLSGRCFLAVTSASEAAHTTISVSSKVRKGFHNPLTGTSGASSSSSSLSVHSNISTRPRHDPTLPNALIMPRPNQKHQLAHNSKGLPLVDVVVDPRLVRHLRPHQREGVLFLYQCVMGMKDYQGLGAILADEMGLGKSLQCITLIWTMLKQGPYGGKPVIRRVIIVTPGSLVKNWEKEFQKWLGHERLNIFAASTENRPEDFIKSPVYPVLLISYEMLMRSHDRLKSVTFDLMICDEGHRLKNASIKTASALMSFPTQRRIVLSGTPIQNDLLEFHSIVEFCNPGLLGSQSAFRKVYQEPIVWSQQPDASADEKLTGEARTQELNRLTSMFCLRRTQEINNQYLPPKIENVVFCQPFPLQLALYKKLLSSPILRSCLSSSYCSTSSSTSSPHLICIGALKKLCNSPSLLHAPATSSATNSSSPSLHHNQSSLYDGLLQCYPSGYSHVSNCLEHSGKLAVLAAMLEQLSRHTREKIVIVSNYTQTLDVLQRLCELYQFSFLRLDGSTASTKRQALVERFNSSTSKESIFLLSSKAGGVGLNLIGASRLVLYDIDWNPANDLQAMARIWRDGQKKTVHIYRLLTTGTIEEKIFQRQISKHTLSVLVDSSSFSSSSSSSSSKAVQFTTEELKDLFTLHENTSCITHDLLKCACTNSTTIQSHSKLEEEKEKEYVKGAEEEKEEVETEEEEYVHVASASRSCDLGVPTKTKEKNLSVDQLKKWKHFHFPLDNTTLSDPLLIAASEYVTFVFQNKINFV